MQYAMQPAQLNVSDRVHLVNWCQAKISLLCAPFAMRARLLELFYFSRAPQSPARSCAGVLSVLEHLHTVYENILHPYCVLMRFLKGGAVSNCRRIEHDHIGKHSFLEKTAMIEPQICGRQSAQASNSFLDWNHFFITYIFAQHAREISVGARMWIGLQENPFRRLRSLIGTK